MRVTSDVFCSALVRTVFGQGGFAAIASRGAREAGAIYVTQRLRSGAFNLYGPAPQSFFDDNAGRDNAVDARKFETLMEQVSEPDISERLQRERHYDPDIWIVELETDSLPSTIRLVEA
ncbi:MAG: DUF1491 family protein [Pseudomonadota bacterium]